LPKEAGVDLNKLSTADRVIGISAIVFLIAMFLPWYGLDFGEFGEASNSGWDYFLSGILPLLLAIVMVAQIAISKFSTTKLPEIPLAWNQVHMIAGAVIAVLLILRTVIGADEGAGGFEVDLDRMYGLFVALIAAIGLAVGGFLKSREPEELTSGSGGYPQGGYPPPPPGGGYPPPPGGGQPQQF
jgi:peptidoglycan/LPS O-acetylase OafA/YrhL